MKQIILFYLVFLSITAVGQNIINYADSIRQANNIPAFAFAVVNSDSILLANVIGIRKINTSDTALLFDKFHLGSNTKAITAFIAGKLVEEEKIKWDTKFFDFFPDLKTAAKSDYYNITLQDLLSHRARVQPFTSGAEFTKLPKFEGSISERRVAFTKWLLTQKPVKIKKEENYVYSNAGYTIAAIMLEKAAEKSWEDLIKQHIEDSLGLKIDFSWPNKINTNQPWGHWKEGKELIALSPDHSYKLDPLVAPAGDINMTLPDYAKFIQQNLKGLLGKKSYLSKNVLEHIHYGFPDYALGWGWQKQENTYISYHDGSAGTFYCHTLIIKEKDLAIIIIANSAEENTIKAIYDLRNKLITAFTAKN